MVETIIIIACVGVFFGIVTVYIIIKSAEGLGTMAYRGF